MSKAKNRAGRLGLDYTRVFLWRHPEVLGGADAKFWGHTDVALSKEGKAQLELIAARMSNVDLRAVYASDLVRSQSVAEAVAKSQNPRRKVDVSPAFRELNLGQWEGMSYQDLERKYPDDLQARMENLPEFVIPGGESVVQMAERVIPAFQEMINANMGHRICLVAHAGVNRVILAKILGAPLDRIFRFDQQYACLNVIDVFEDGIPLVRSINQPLEHPFN